MTFEHRVSGYDFVRALLLAGFRLTGATMGQAVLEKDGRFLSVPQRVSLEEDEIAALLTKAGVLPLQLVTLLERLGSRDTMPGAREDELHGSRRRG